MKRGKKWKEKGRIGEKRRGFLQQKPEGDELKEKRLTGTQFKDMPSKL